MWYKGYIDKQESMSVFLILKYFIWQALYIEVFIEDEIFII